VARFNYGNFVGCSDGRAQALRIQFRPRRSTTRQGRVVPRVVDQLIARRSSDRYDPETDLLACSLNLMRFAARFIVAVKDVSSVHEYRSKTGQTVVRSLCSVEGARRGRGYS